MKTLTCWLLMAGVAAAEPVRIGPPVKSQAEIDAMIAAPRIDQTKLDKEIADFIAADKDYKRQLAELRVGKVKGGVREEDGDGPTKPSPPPPPTPAYHPAGAKFMSDGYWYTADGKGYGHWCTECNGMTCEEAIRRIMARQAPQANRVHQVSRGPGVAVSVPFTQGTTAPGAGGPGTFRTGATPTGRTTMLVSPAGWYGGTNAGCATGG